MYEEFYGLTEKPFSIQPDPDFLYFGKRHSLAYSMLEYSVENRAGFSVITGEIGSGKTTLVSHLLNNLPQTTTVGLISNTHPDIANLLEWVMLSFDQPYDGLSQVALYHAFQNFLIGEYSKGHPVILVVDEAQNLSLASLEALRMFSNINMNKHQLLQIILVGQPELRDILRRPELKQFVQRVAVDFHITALTQAESELYIIHRLAVAGRKAQLFSHEASLWISMVSKGIPRSINILCDTALVYGFSMGVDRIDVEIVKEVLRDKAKFGVFLADDDPDVDGAKDETDQSSNYTNIIERSF